MNITSFRRFLISIILITIGSSMTWATITEFSYNGLKYEYDSFDGSVNLCAKQIISGEVTIPGKVPYNNREYTVYFRYIGTFANSTSLKKITFGEGIQHIASETFRGCTALEEVKLSSTVIQILGSAFRDCKKLKSINTEKVQYFSSLCFSGCESLHYINLTSMKNSDQRAFAGASGLKEIILPTTITNIGPGTFRDCTSLTEITIPENVSKIGASSLFAGCTALKTIYWNAKKAVPYLWSNPDSNDPVSSKTIFYSFNNKEIAPPVETIVFGDEVESIPDYLCNNLPTLKKVVVGKNMKTFGKDVFENCTGIQEVYWNATNCNSNGNTKFWWTDDKQQRKSAPITTFKIGDFVKSIPTWLCSYMHKTESITIPGTVTNIGACAFYHSSGLSKIDIPTGVETIGVNAFAHMSNITSFTIPWSVNEIGKTAFSNCEKLKSVTFNAKECTVSDPFENSPKLTSITFQNEVIKVPAGICKGLITLNSVHFGSAVKTIETAAFSGCSALKDIELSGTISRIEQEAFNKCSSIENIFIGSNVYEIGNYAFNGCNKIKLINSQAMIPPTIYANTFSNYSATLRVPYDCEKRYQSDKYWVKFFPASGIDGIEADKSEVVDVYSLDGLLLHTQCRLSDVELRPGVYVIVSNGKSSKIMIK